MISLVLAVYLSKPDVALHYYFGTTLVTAFFGWRLLAYDKESKTQEEQGGEFSLLSYWSFWVSLFLMQVSFGGYYNFFTLYESGFGIDLETISYLWVFAIVCEILIFYYQAPLLKRNLLLIIKFALLATTLRWVLLHFFGDHLWVVFVTQAFHALSFGLYHSAVILYLYEIYENKKLAQQFMLGIAYGLGGFVGAILAGYIYGEYLFLISGIISFGAFLFLYFDRMLQK